MEVLCLHLVLTWSHECLLLALARLKCCIMLVQHLVNEFLCLLFGAGETMYKSIFFKYKKLATAAENCRKGNCRVGRLFIGFVSASDSFCITVI